MMSEAERLIFEKYAKNQTNPQQLEKMFDELIHLAPVAYDEGRFDNLKNGFFNYLSAIKIKCFSDKLKNKFQQYLQKIYSEIPDTHQHKKRELVHLMGASKEKFLPGVLIDPIHSAQLTSSFLHRSLTSDGLNLKPRRIIAFNQFDVKNKEVKDAVKIIYEKHKAEGCLITCSVEDIKNFGQECETLVLIGHGCFYHLGERDKNISYNQEMIVKAQMSTHLFLGPHQGNIEALVTALDKDIAHLPKLKHCRMLMCRAGSFNLNFNPIHFRFYRKADGDKPNKSLMAVWDAKQPGALIFDEYSLAYALWHKLFIEPNARFSAESDFALTAAAGIIKPERTDQGKTPGFFRLDDPFHTKDPNVYLATQYTTLVTPNSSKLEKRLASKKYKSI